MDSVPCIFAGKGVITICYIDDLLVFAKEEGKIEELKKKLNRQLAMRDLGRPGSFLDIDLVWTKEAVYLSQKRWARKL